MKITLMFFTKVRLILNKKKSVSRCNRQLILGLNEKQRY